MSLKTKRLTLRLFTKQDLDALFFLMSHPEVMRFSIKGPLSRAEVEEYLQNKILLHYEQFGFGLWAVIESEENRLIGYAGLMSQAIEGERFIELGYRLDPAYWGRGLASEAAEAIVEYAFHTLRLRELIAIIDPRNTRSIRVALGLRMHLWKETNFHGISVGVYMLKKIALSPYDPAWKARFEEERAKLYTVFEERDVTLFHIGSTSIEGCSAKPIIDILGVTSDILTIDAINPKMIDLGFRPLGEYGMKQRRFFHRQHPFPVNLHIFEETDPEVGRHLRFCQYLSAHPEKVDEYSELKKTLANVSSHNIQTYLAGKDRWIKEIDILAAWSFTSLFPEKKSPKRKEWRLEEIIQGLEVNMHLQMSAFAKYIPSVELLFEPDVTVVRSTIADDTFNYVLSARFTEKNKEARILHVQDLFTKASLPFSWWVGESDTPHDLKETLTKYECHYKETTIGMYADISSVKPLLYSPLTFKRVDTLQDFQAFTEVLEAVGVSSQIFTLIYSKLPPVMYKGGSFFEFYVGYLGNIPIVTGMLVTHANVAGIYYLATRPQEQKKGFGTAMMSHLLHRANTKGYTIATLQASHRDLSLYEKFGFKKCCTFIEYGSKG